MAIVRLLNDEAFDEQGALEVERSTRRVVYAFDPKDPLNLHEFGGHNINDAPEYALQEPVPRNRRRTVDGLNITEFEHIDEEYIQGTDYTMALPERRVTLAHQIKRVERRTRRKFRWVIIPASNANCANDCDRFAIMMGLSGKLGEIQETGAVVAYDYEGDGGVVTKTIMLRTEGASIDYQGLRNDPAVLTATDAIYSLLVGSRAECNDDFCPYQIGYAFSAAGSVTAPVANRTTDKWGSAPAVINTAAIAVAQIITSSVWWRGDLYVGHASGFKATSTAGDVSKSASGTSAFVDVSLTSSGIQALVVAGSKLHAFGEAGEWHWTQDGENWTTETAITSEDLYCAAYNPKTKRIYVGGSNGAAFSIRGGKVVLALTGFGVENLTACKVAGDDHVVFGTDAGKIWEHFSQVEDGGVFTTTKTFASGAAINSLLGDNRQTNLVASVGDTVWQRSLDNYQDWRSIGVSPGGGVINAGSQGYEEHRQGTDYFVFGTDDGTLYEVQNCVECAF